MTSLTFLKEMQSFNPHFFFKKNNCKIGSQYIKCFSRIGQMRPFHLLAFSPLTLQTQHQEREKSGYREIEKSENAK